MPCKKETFMRIPKKLLKEIKSYKISKGESYAEVIERKLRENSKLNQKLLEKERRI